jgi:hypothetical protein
MHRRYISFLAQHPSVLAPGFAVTAAKLRSTELGRRNPQHPHHDRHPASKAGVSARVQLAKPEE